MLTAPVPDMAQNRTVAQNPCQLTGSPPESGLRTGGPGFAEIEFMPCNCEPVQLSLFDPPPVPVPLRIDIHGEIFQTAFWNLVSPWVRDVTSGSDSLFDPVPPVVFTRNIGDLSYTRNSNGSFTNLSLSEEIAFWTGISLLLSENSTSAHVPRRPTEAHQSALPLSGDRGLNSRGHDPE